LLDTEQFYILKNFGSILLLSARDEIICCQDMEQNIPLSVSGIRQHVCFYFFYFVIQAGDTDSVPAAKVVKLESAKCVSSEMSPEDRSAFVHLYSKL